MFKSPFLLNPPPFAGLQKVFPQALSRQLSDFLPTPFTLDIEPVSKEEIRRTPPGFFVTFVSVIPFATYFDPF